MSKISENIKNLRLYNNMTQEKLAEKLSVTRQTVSCWENGKSEPDIETLMKLSKIFDININELLNSEINERKTYLGIKIFSAILFIAVLIGILPFIKQDNNNQTFNDVLENQSAYSFNITEIENKYFKLFETNNKIEVSKNDIDSSEHIIITKCEYYENGNLTIRGKSIPIYQNNNGGKIIIPAVYSSEDYLDSEDFLSSVCSLSKESSTVKNIKTGSGIIIKTENPFDSKFLYNSVPVFYEVDKDGNVEFEFVFKKSENNKPVKSIKDLISENHSPLIVLQCATLEWETAQTIENIYNKIDE